MELDFEVSNLDTDLRVLLVSDLQYRWIYSNILDIMYQPKMLEYLEV